MLSVLSPGSVLLSANGNLAFKSCARHEDVASFTAPEVQQGHAASSRTAAEKVGNLQKALLFLLWGHLLNKHHTLKSCTNPQRIQNVSVISNNSIKSQVSLMYLAVTFLVYICSSDGCILPGDDSLLVR